MSEASLPQRLHAALNKLCKWRSVFAGWQLGTCSIENETARAIRDHREVTMLLRAEATAMLALQVKKGVFTLQEWQAELLEQVEHLDKSYEKKFPGFRSQSDGVLIYNTQLAADTTRNWNP